MMMMFRIILTTLISFPIPAMVLSQDKPVEVRHGTVLVYERTSYQVIVVVDSRILTKEKGKPNKGCKIETFSTDTAFFYSGNLFQGFETKSGKEVFSQLKIAAEPTKTFDHTCDVHKIGWQAEGPKSLDESFRASE